MTSSAVLAADVAPLPYRALFEQSPTPKLIVDKTSLAIVAVNTCAAATYGYEPGEMRGLPLRALWPRAPDVLATLGARPTRMELLTWRHWRKDGSALDVSIGFQDLELDGRQAIVLHVTDVTERAFSVALLEMHGDILEAIAHGGALGQVLERLVLATERLAPGMIGSILLRDGARARLGAAPHLPADYWRALDGLPIGPGVGSCGTAMHRGEPVIVRDVATDPLWKDYRDLALPHGLRACWSTPIFSRSGSVLGAFALYYREPRAPGGRELRAVHAAAQLASVALERDLGERALRESEGRLRTIVDHASAVVYLKDLAGRHLLVNRQFEQMTGIAAAAAIGKTDRELFPAELAEALVANDRRVAQTRTPVSIEEEMMLADGRHIFLSAKFPLLDEQGSVTAIGGISTDITGRKRAERELQASREDLRALSQQLQRVREEERARISREIHDELGQLLSGLNMNQALLLRDLRARGAVAEDAARQVESMQELVRRLIASVRRIATDLRPEVLDALGIGAALEWQAADFARRTGIACEVRLAEPALPLDVERSTALFRIFQEALSNVARHSKAKRVIAQLRVASRTVTLIVADDGCGLAEGAARESPALGLLGMRERAAMLGGEARIEGAPGRGTTVSVRLPL